MAEVTMSEQRAPYQTNSNLLPHDIKCVNVDARSIKRVLDPETGRFLFEYDTERDMVIWYERGRRIAIPLEQYR